MIQREVVWNISVVIMVWFRCFERKSRRFRANVRLFCFEESNEADFMISWCVVHHWVQRTKSSKDDYFDLLKKCILVSPKVRQV